MNFLNKLTSAVQKGVTAVDRTVQRQISNISDTVDSARGQQRRGKKMANVGSFKTAWQNYLRLIDEFHTECAS